MYFNRRRQPRVIPRGFSFVQVERDDGGQVVNLSEDGLCFEAFSSISVTDTVHFWFSLDLHDRIEAVGRLAWMDAVKGIGGLKFTALSEAARRKIRDYITGVSAEEAAAEKENTFAGAPSNDALAAPPIEPSIPRKPSIPQKGSSGFSIQPQLLLREQKGVPLESANRGAQITETAAADSFTQLVPLERYLAMKRSQFYRGFALGILVASLVAIPFFRYGMHGQQGEELKAPAKQNTLGNTGEQAELAGGNSRPDAPPVPAVSSLTRTQTPRPSSYTPTTALDLSPGRPQHQSLPSRSTGTDPVASPALSDSTRAAKNSASPDQLWTAVQAGNDKAAVTLANLYLTGDGVPVNCAQAKVLLQVASQKSNAQAIRKLKELESSGCPTP